MENSWFAEWFNTPYYHLLYNNRNTHEATVFVKNIAARLQPSGSANLLDIACGTGRYSIEFHKKGFCVTGIDLSVNNITAARKHQAPCLQFFVHDMRRVLYTNYFQYAVNLFTSFGYFNTVNDHIQALKVFNSSLVPGGTFIIDYLNVQPVLNTLPKTEIQKRDDIDFHIHKSLQNANIVKNIQFTAHGQQHIYSEVLKAFTLNDFNSMLAQAGFTVTDVFGNYNLDRFDVETSDRLILFCTKA